MDNLKVNESMTNIIIDDQVFDLISENDYEKIISYIDEMENIDCYFKKTTDDGDSHEPAYTILLALVNNSNLNNIRVIEYLLKKGANIDLPEIYCSNNSLNADELDSARKGYTALLTAINKQKPELVKLLLEHNADPNLYFIQDYENSGYDFTPLDLALELKNHAIISLLLEYHAISKKKPEILISELEQLSSSENNFARYIQELYAKPKTHLRQPQLNRSSEEKKELL